MRRTVLAALLLLASACASFAVAGQATVAVASNFLPVARDLSATFEAETGHRIALAPGSTGRLYAQILNGAPFDLFLAADQLRPALLNDAGLVAERQTYALGQLVLVAQKGLPFDPEDLKATLSGRRVALADAKVAPYGAAGDEVLARAGIDRTEDAVFLLGENVGQVANILATGNAEYGFLSAAQVPMLPGEGWQIAPMAGRHGLIRQDVALLKSAAKNEAAAAFYNFLVSPRAAAILGASGYEAAQ
ncbi:MAG: molybdate ABC transporter substrate-binding protein [Alphaproteobacteria bacterium]|nr:molybdate ABC transporter substrate-binding protein [Alphaproteobacteria bacterium]